MNIDKVLEFNKIKERWKELSFTESAKKKIEEASFSLKENEVRKNIKDTTGARTFIEQCGTPPLVSMDEAKEIMKQAAAGLPCAQKQKSKRQRAAKPVLSSPSCPMRYGNPRC